MMLKACVIGWPIKHSRSPLIHNYWLKKYEIAGSYNKIAVSQENLPSFIEEISLEKFCGCNVTIPHKEQVFGLVVVKDLVTIKIGAVNTIYRENNITYGLNTDGFGFISNLRSVVPDWDFSGKRCLIIGAGGAARAIIAALLTKGVSNIILANRTIEKAQNLGKHFGSNITPIQFQKINENLGDIDLLINTTSLGMTGQPELEINLDRLSRASIVTDIVYVPLETQLLKEARQRGNTTVDGLGMLLHQAVPGFEKWFGIRPEVTTELRQLILHDLEQDTNK
jgi:shikimate dehydrogenase